MQEKEKQSRRVRLNLSYDGTRFRGWQIQPDAWTVQGEIERALKKFYGGRDVRICGSGRTDTGVHAVGQVAHYDAPVEREMHAIERGLNSLVGEGVCIWRAKRVEEDFHARFQATRRVYGYRILREDSLFEKRYGWPVPYMFEASRLGGISEVFLGKYDFRAFSTQPDPEESTICNLSRFEWFEDSLGWVAIIEADRFIRRMVRTLIGTVVEIAAGKKSIEDIELLLAGKGTRAGVPAPAKGLALLRVFYDSDDEGDCPSPSPWRGNP